MKLTDNQMKNLVGQILYCLAEGCVLNELGLNIAVQNASLNDIQRNGYKEVATTIQEFLNDISHDSKMYEYFP